MTKDYSDWSKEELIRELEKLKKRKKYGIVWEDALEEEAELVCKEQLPVLEEDTTKAIITSEEYPTNVIIEGDNYHSLSILNYTHKSAIDFIYIDPPYNTGNKDFIYNDRYVDIDDVYRHSKWLNFMSKRLLLAKNLLKEDGIICISIDDNEQAQLKLLCDEIFHEANRLSTHHIQVRYADKTLNEKNDWQPVMEYVLLYAKNGNYFKANKPTVDYSIDKFIYEITELAKGTEITVKKRKVTVFRKGEWKITKHKTPDNSLLKETWVSGSIYSGTGNGTMVQNVIEPRIEIDKYGSLYKIDGLGEDGLGYRYFTGPQKIGATRSKMYTGIPLIRSAELSKGAAVRYKSIANYYDFSPDFGNIRSEGGISFNSGKKPIKMLKQLINYHQNKNAVVLDFFAGSGSLGHALLELNQEDGGLRKFILCTNNENNIAAESTYPRIRNVIKGYGNEEGIPANLTYFKTSFVPAVQTDKNKLRLAQMATGMLCLKEDCFHEVPQEGNFKIFTNSTDRYVGIIYDDAEIEAFKNVVKKIHKKISVYVFSLDESTKSEEFESIGDLVDLKAIPAVILNVYKRIFI
ncbi:MAG TPA: site-specific DNA-methyltransferase [Candidatus Saccharimonadales bacterium]|nr:site-specific DNA-methyltransferase [Candidatus Saccharimonadales bacterium]